jgi:cell wall-associated NlpC family hydrolase
VRRVATAGVCAFLVSLSLGASARAATLTVDSAADGGAGSLQAAITEANASPRGDRIVFTPGIGGAIALKRSLPVIRAPLRIEGPGAAALSLTGTGVSRLFEVDLSRAGEVDIAGLTLRGGVGAAGGAIASSGANLVLDHMVLTGNRARGFGGALAISGGTLTLLSSRLAGNGARLGGGAIGLRGAGLNIASSTIVRNVAGGDGGGIATAASGDGLLIEGSTIAGNRAGGNGGAVSLGGAPKKALALSGSKLLDNRAAGRGGALFSAAGAPPTLEGATVHGNASGAGGPSVVGPEPAPKPRPRGEPPRMPATAGTNGSWSPTAADRRVDSILAESLTVPGSTLAGPSATLLGGVALAPPEAPPAIQAVISAANAISHTPYIWGGGHASWFSPGYDCSGAVSFALHGGGFLSAPLASGQLESWGAPGPGRWLTVYANATHAYAVVAGLRWDTVGDASGSGPRWHLGGAYPEGFVARHPPGY